MQPAPPAFGYAPAPVPPGAVAPAPYAAAPPAAAAVRLPLQIGTSSLWSLARGAGTLLPGLAIVVGGFPVLLGAWTVALAMFVLGGLLVWFAVMHLRLAARSRPSDVLLDGVGLRIDGGVHDGRAIRWFEVEPRACAVETTQEKRYTLIRILGNFFAVLLSLLARGNKFYWIKPALIDVARLHVGLRDGSRVVVAEAERPIEKESLEALHDAITSAGWHGAEPAGAAPVPAPARPAARKRHTAMGLQVLLCPRCGAVAAPEDRPQIACRYCQSAITVPPELQERIRASNQVAAGRGTSERLVGQLLQQPGARQTGSRLFAAAVPMMLAWPIAFVVLAAAEAVGGLEAGGVVELLLFPVAVILGLFFLLRAKLADRFALRLLTLDFGATRPAREGDPHQCRQCDAPLPDRPGSVLVRCAYCSADNILGVDLRRQAGRVTDQASSLEDALAKRTRERSIWGALTAVAVLLMLAGGGFLVDAVAGVKSAEPAAVRRAVTTTPPPPQTPAVAPTATTPPKPATPSPVKPAVKSPAPAKPAVRR